MKMNRASSFDPHCGHRGNSSSNYYQCGRPELAGTSQQLRLGAAAVPGARTTSHGQHSSVLLGMQQLQHQQPQISPIPPSAIGATDSPDNLSGGVPSAGASSTKKKAAVSGGCLFPSRLHYVLNELEKDALDDVMSWHPCGSSFIVHNRERLEKEVLPLYVMPRSLVVPTAVWMREHTCPLGDTSRTHPICLRFPPCPVLACTQVVPRIAIRVLPEAAQSVRLYPNQVRWYVPVNCFFFGFYAALTLHACSHACVHFLKGPDNGGYYHQYMRREFPELASKIQKRSAKGAGLGRKGSNTTKKHPQNIPGDQDASRAAYIRAPPGDMPQALVMPSLPQDHQVVYRLPEAQLPSGLRGAAMNPGARMRSLSLDGPTDHSAHGHYQHNRCTSHDFLFASRFSPLLSSADHLCETRLAASLYGTNSPTFLPTEPSIAAAASLYQSSADELLRRQRVLDAAVASAEAEAEHLRRLLRR